MDDYEVDAEQLGVATALERTCALEARLRQALQDTHVVSRDYGHDAEAVERERDALLSIKDQLELLEDKLREYRALDSNQHDDKTVVLSQLYSLRRELITIAQDGFAAVTFSKDVVREVQAFAEMRDEFTTDSDTESEMTYDFAEDGSVYSNFSPERVSGGQQHSSTVALEGSVSGDSPQRHKAQKQHAWAERRHDSTSYTPQQPAARMPSTPHRVGSGGTGVSSPGTGAYAPAGHTRREAPEYRPAADRILTGRRPADHSVHTCVADRIMLGGMPGSPEPQPQPPGDKTCNGVRDGQLQLGDSPSDAALRRSPSVQAPVTPNSPESRKPPNSRPSASTTADARPAGGWAARMRNMWHGASAQPAGFLREDDAAGNSHSHTAADDPQYGGKLNVQGLAAKPVQASPRRAPPQMPYVQDTSAGVRGAAAARPDARGTYSSDHNSGSSGKRPRRLRGALAALASAAIGATAVFMYQNQDGFGNRSCKAALRGVASHYAGIQPVEQKPSDPNMYSMPLPDVNLGRG